MIYVLQEKDPGEQYDWYVYSEKYVHVSISKAKLFKTKTAVKKFQSIYDWYGKYKVIGLSRKELFEARLRGE